MPAARKWRSLGCGSYRQIRRGVYEVNYRPHGSAGKQVRRRIAADENEIVELIVAASRNKSRRQTGLPQVVSWTWAETIYLEHLDAKGVAKDYQAKLRTLIRQLKDHARAAGPCEIDVVRFELFLNQIAKSGQDAKRPGWARTTNKKRAMLHGFFRFLVRRRIMQSNPADAVDQFKETKRPPRNLTPEEYARVWAKCEPPLRDLLDFLVLTGCRFGEAQRLKFADISDAGVWTCTGRKNRDYFKQQLSPVVVALLARREKTPDDLVWHKATTRKGGPGGHGFQAGDPIDQRWLWEAIRARCQQAGVERFRIHDLRHAAASWAAAHGATPWEIKAHLGHSALATTERYTHAIVGSNLGASVLEEVRNKAIQAVAGKEVK